MLDRGRLFRYLGLTDPATSPDVYDDAVAYANDQISERLVAVELPAVWPEPYYYAASRYAARYLAARGAPLGQADLGEFGAAPLYSRDPEISAVMALYGKAPLA